ncbi:MAG: hypothetical protein NTW74_03850 [Acidobacteria bacterium]|nr:hypothetical protein [Acidobacteriota bacterium]
MDFETIELNNFDSSSAVVYAPAHVDSVVIALHGFAMPASVMCATLFHGNQEFLVNKGFALVCPEAKLADPVRGLFPHWERPTLDEIVPTALQRAKDRWPNAKRHFLVGHSYGGRGVALQGFDLAFNAYGLIAPYAETEAEFEAIYQKIQTLEKPLHLAFSRNDAVAWAASMNAQRLLNLQNGHTRIVTDYPMSLFELPHNGLILKQSQNMFHFLDQH